MTDTETAILTTLREFEATASRRGLILPAMAELDRLTRLLPKDSNPDLLHYLHKRSYEKARLLLEGSDPEAGACPKG